MWAQPQDSLPPAAGWTSPRSPGQRPPDGDKNGGKGPIPLSDAPSAAGPSPAAPEQAALGSVAREGLGGCGRVIGSSCSPGRGWAQSPPVGANCSRGWFGCTETPGTQGGTRTEVFGAPSVDANRLRPGTGSGRDVTWSRAGAVLYPLCVLPAQRLATPRGSPAAPRRLCAVPAPWHGAGGASSAAGRAGWPAWSAGPGMRKNHHKQPTPASN